MLLATNLAIPTWHHHTQVPASVKAMWRGRGAWSQESWKDLLGTWCRWCSRWFPWFPERALRHLPSPKLTYRHIDPKNSKVLVETHLSSPKLMDLMAVSMFIGRQGTRDEEWWISARSNQQIPKARASDSESTGVSYQGSRTLDWISESVRRLMWPLRTCFQGKKVTVPRDRWRVFFLPVNWPLTSGWNEMKWDETGWNKSCNYMILYVTKVMNTHSWAFKPVTAVLRAWSNCGDRMSPVAQFRSLHPSGTLESWLLQLGMRYDAI